jgi:RNA polymerase sigma factor (sigma-70 family)
VDAEHGLVPATAMTVIDPARVLRDSAFSAFYRGSSRKVLVTLYAAGATRPEAEDAVADGMAAVLKAWGRIEEPLAYARTAALHSFFDARKRGRRNEPFDPEMHDDGRIDPRLTVWEDKQWVKQLLDSLPPAQREAMALVVDLYTPTEIAHVLGARPDAIRKRLQVARKQLVEQLADDDRTDRQGGTNL